MASKIFKEKGFVDPIKINRNLGLKVITHAVHNRETFLKILNCKQIKLPSQLKKVTKKSPYLEKIFGIDDCVYLGSGFDYNAKQHQWDYAFLFKLNILNRPKIHTYKTFLISQSWLKFLRFIRDNEPKLLKQISERTADANEEIRQFLETDSAGHFWKYESSLIWGLENSKNKPQILKLMKSFVLQQKLKNSSAARFVSKHYFDDYNNRRIEILSKKAISLEDKNFLGVYIKGDKLNDILPRIRNKLQKNILIYTKEKVFNLF